MVSMADMTRKIPFQLILASAEKTFKCVCIQCLCTLRATLKIDMIRHETTYTPVMYPALSPSMGENYWTGIYIQ